MKKKIFTIFALSSLLSLSVCNSSCSKDDDDDNNKEQVDNNDGEKPGDEEQPAEGGTVNKDEAKQQADAITNSIKELIAANQNNSAAANDALSNLFDGIKDVQLSGNEAQKNEVIKQVADATGLDTNTIGSLVNGETPAYVKEVIDGLSKEQIDNIIGNPDAYAKAYEDAQKLNGFYILLNDPSATYEQKMAALDGMEAGIKANYQASTDPVYKETYLETAAKATGLSKEQAKLVLDAESPKDVIATLLGIKDDSGNNNPGTENLDAAKGKEDGLVAAAFLKELNGKTMMEVMGSGFLTDFMGYRANYMNGNDDYKMAFKQTLLDEGISSDVTDAFDSETQPDIMKLAAALAIKMA